MNWESWVMARTGARKINGSALLQNLWSGYGELLRVSLAGGSFESVILKRVVPPSGARESVSDARKRKSYLVEQAWYRGGSALCSEGCRVARCLGVEKSLLLLEDLGTAGFFPGRPRGERDVRAGLSWLAHFHARFLGDKPDGLWKQGSYWHLDTRQEELRRMPAGPLKEAAGELDLRLKRARFQTLVHGDAKPANFCWGGDSAAAVDFQYVGMGCGMRDVAYFLDCCVPEAECEGWLDFYFAELRTAGGWSSELEAEWRGLFPVAWSDYTRFMQGWGSPSPLGRFGERMLREALGS